MFYSTTIKSVGSNGVIDVQGRRLNFIGYMSVKEGDTVYTDGKVIFGNAPPKGSPAIFDEQGGIPVLGDFDSSGENELRGYFTPKGKFKKYSIKGDEWITNSEKKYAHDDGEVEGIIDAEITRGGDKFIVKKGIYQESHTLETTYVTGCVNDVYLFRDSMDRSLCISLVGYGVRKEMLGSEDFPNEQLPAQILKNGAADDEFDLKPFANDVQERALLCAAEIMKKEYTLLDVQANDLEPLSPMQESEGVSYITLENVTNKSRRLGEYLMVHPSYFGYPNSYGWVFYRAPGLIDENAYPQPDAPFIAYTSAHIISSNVDENGFNGVVFASAYGYCFPHIRPRFTMLGGSGVTGASYNKIYEWKCVPFGISCFYKVGEDNLNDKIEPVAFHDFGGVNCNVTVSETANLTYPVSYNTSKSTTSALSTRHIELLTNFDTKEISDVFFPVGKGFYKMDKFGRLTFYDSDKKFVAENIPVHDDFWHLEIEHSYFLQEMLHYDFNDKPRLVCKIYTPDGEAEEARISLRDVDTLGTVSTSSMKFIEGAEVTIPPMDGYYIKHEDGALEPLNFTPLFYQFKNGNCLCGVKGGKLYLVTGDGQVEQVGDGLKNFRLRELKKISKAKK